MFATISAFMGHGAPGLGGDGGHRSQASLDVPAGMAYDPVENALLIAEYGAHRIRSVSLGDGTVTTLLGRGGTAGSSPSGVPASQCLLHSPESMSVDPLGDVYVTDSLNHVVRRLNRSGEKGRKGTVDIVAGTGVKGFTPAGRRALDVMLSEPIWVEPAHSGGLYVLDYYNHRVLLLDDRGFLQPFAGTGAAGYTGDGPATQSPLGGPHGMAQDVEGNVYIADNWNRRVRKVRLSDGIMVTVAGNGQFGCGGDGGPALKATLSGPKDIDGIHGVAVVDGEVLIADSGNNRIRSVSADGIIRTVAGTGRRGFANGDGRPLDADLTGPDSLLLLPDGTLLFCEYATHCVRALSR